MLGQISSNLYDAYIASDKKQLVCCRARTSVSLARALREGLEYLNQYRESVSELRFWYADIEIRLTRKSDQLQITQAFHKANFGESIGP